MAPSRLDVAERVARDDLNSLLPKGTSRGRLRSDCFARLAWVMRGGNRPAIRTTPFVRRTVVQAVNVGLEHAYGDSHKSEIDPQIYVRRDAD